MIHKDFINVLIITLVLVFGLTMYQSFLAYKEPISDINISSATDPIDTSVNLLLLNNLSNRISP